MRLDDTELYAAWLKDLETTVYLAANSNVNLLAEREWLEEALHRQETIFAIVAKDSGRLIGNVGLHNVD